ncbi:hypothetical protein SK128_026630, partial [Halocaridina rubra]
MSCSRRRSYSPSPPYCVKPLVVLRVRSASFLIFLFVQASLYSYSTISNDERWQRRW